MSVLASEVQPLAGIPAPDLLGQAVLTMIRPVLPNGLAIAEGPTLTVDTPDEVLLEHLADRPNFSAQGSKRTEVTVRWTEVIGHGLPFTSALRTFVDVDIATNGQAGELLDTLTTTTRLLAAPFAYLEPIDAGFRDRQDHHRELYQNDKTGRDRVFGLLRGFSGVPWRTILGPESVRFFGADRLGALPAELATDLGDGYWLLSPCESPDEWNTGCWNGGEAAIIEALGPDRFFDPSCGRLPTEYPDLPECAPIPVKTRRRGPDGEAWIWEYHNGCLPSAAPS